MGSVQEHVEHDAVVDLIRREPTDHDAIRELWKKHSLAEDARDLPGLISTLTPTASTSSRRPATGGRATRAQRASTPSCSTAFPDIHFDLTTS